MISSNARIVTIRCEFPVCGSKIVDVHHINSSFRGKRTNEPDWSDLIWLCRLHHEFVHNNNNYDMRQYLLDTVKKILDDKEHRLWLPKEQGEIWSWSEEDQED